MEATTKDCYIKVTLQNCNKAVDLKVLYHQTDTGSSYTINGNAKSACLKVKCTSNNRLSSTLDIGGEHEQSGEMYVAKANPGTVNSQITSGLYMIENKCKSGKASISTVTCVDEKGKHWKNNHPVKFNHNYFQSAKI